MIKIGTDIIEIERIKKAMGNQRFLKKIFTQNEIKFINKKGAMSCATTFAGKEAVAKALGTGFSLLKIRDIEILRSQNGTPFIVLHNTAKEIATKQGINSLSISLSHCKKYAIATVLVY